MGLGQYDSLGVYCGPHTASEVFLITEAGTIEVFGKCQIEGIPPKVLERPHLQDSNRSASKE